MKADLAGVMRTGEVMILSGDELEPEPLWESAAILSAAHVPLKAPRGTIGVLALGSRSEAGFAAGDVGFLTQIGRQLAIAIENAAAFTNLKDKFAREKLYLEDEIRSELNFGEIVFQSETMRRILQQVETVAPTDSTVLIHGETGTGKELIARALHDLSNRRSNAFVKVNCAAIPGTLLESELFGHERGAFTGAVANRMGRFELANHGTLFLDEIGELPLELQPKLLRVLQEHEFERLGSTRTLHADVRLIAATNRDLQELIRERNFRSDLYYRLNVFPVYIPPLRERPEDIPAVGSPLCATVRPPSAKIHRYGPARNDGYACPLSMAGECPRTAERPGASFDSCARPRLEDLERRSLDARSRAGESTRPSNGPE